MSLAAAEALASVARKQAASWRLTDRLAAVRAKRELIAAGWFALSTTIVIR